MTFQPTDTEVDTDHQATVNEAADVLIQRKMVGIGYVHTRWSEDHDALTKAWNSWLADAGLLDWKLHSEISRVCLDLIQARVDHFSAEWKELGHWGFEGHDFCGLCEDPPNRGDCTVKFTTWITQQTQSDDWNGNFTEVRSFADATNWLDTDFV